MQQAAFSAKCTAGSSRLRQASGGQAAGLRCECLLRTDTGFQLQLDSLAATLDETRWGDARLALDYQAEDDEHQPQWKLRADRLHLTPLVPFS